MKGQTPTMECLTLNIPKLDTPKKERPTIDIPASINNSPTKKRSNAKKDHGTIDIPPSNTNSPTKKRFHAKKDDGTIDIPPSITNSPTKKRSPTKKDHSKIMNLGKEKNTDGNENKSILKNKIEPCSPQNEIIKARIAANMLRRKVVSLRRVNSDLISSNSSVSSIDKDKLKEPSVEDFRLKIQDIQNGSSQIKKTYRRYNNNREMKQIATLKKNFTDKVRDLGSNGIVSDNNRNFAVSKVPEKIFNLPAISENYRSQKINALRPQRQDSSRLYSKESNKSENSYGDRLERMSSVITMKSQNLREGSADSLFSPKIFESAILTKNKNPLETSRYIQSSIITTGSNVPNSSSPQRKKSVWLKVKPFGAIFEQTEAKEKILSGMVERRKSMHDNKKAMHEARLYMKKYYGSKETSYLPFELKKYNTEASRETSVGVGNSRLASSIQPKYKKNRSNGSAGQQSVLSDFNQFIRQNRIKVVSEREDDRSWKKQPAYGGLFNTLIRDINGGYKKNPKLKNVQYQAENYYTKSKYKEFYDTKKYSSKY